MVQRGKELGYTMGNEQFNSIVENIKKENKIETDEQLQAALKQEGMTMADLRRQLESRCSCSACSRPRSCSKLQVTDAELKTYYEAHKDEFATVPQVTLREILIAVPATDAGRQRRRRTMRRRRRPRTCASICRRRAVRAAGRRLFGFAVEGQRRPGRPAREERSAPPELQKAIDGLKTGDVTPVLRTPRGYQIIKIESLQDATTKPFDERAATSPTRSPTSKRQGEFAKFLEQAARARRSSTGRTTRSRRPTKSA